MDPFDLDLNPAMSGGIFYQQKYSNDSINYFDSNDYSCFDKMNQDDNFAENFNKVFHPATPDNKEDSISEIDYNNLNINNVDEFIIRFQKESLDNLYFKKDFDGIINQIEKHFPFFFNEKDEGLLYLIEKLRFFNLLKEKKYDEAKKFYQDKLIILIKEVKKHNWETKSKFFIKLLKKPNLIEKQGDLQKKYYDQFCYELEKAIRGFLHEENDDNQNKNDFMSSSNNMNFFVSSNSIEFDNLQKFNYNKESNYEKNYKKDNSKDKETEDGDNEINIIKNNNNEEKDELDLDNFSTKEEFSDFEDELQPKISGENEGPKEEYDDKNQKNNNFIKLNTFINDDNEENIDLDPVDNNNPIFSNFSSCSFSKSNSHKSSLELEQKEDDENIKKSNKY